MSGHGPDVWIEDFDDLRKSLYCPDSPPPRWRLASIRFKGREERIDGRLNVWVPVDWSQDDFDEAVRSAYFAYRQECPEEAWPPVSLPRFLRNEEMDPCQPPPEPRLVTEIDWEEEA